MVGCALLVVCCGCSGADDAATPPPNRLLSGDVLSIAHGGAAAVAPKQTLLSYQKAAEAEADVLEVDVHATSDGVLVVIHDETVDATTDGSGVVKEKTFAELRALDAGYRWTKDGGQTFPFRGQGLVVPSFDELLAAFPEAYWVVEIKQAEPPIVAPLLELLDAKGAAGRTIVAAFKDEVIAEVRTQAPEMLTSLSTGEALELLFLAPEEEAEYVPPARFVQPPASSVTAERVELVHRLEMKIHPWTVNEPAEMQALIAMGVDGIITDDPATLEGLLAP